MNVDSFLLSINNISKTSAAFLKKNVPYLIEAFVVSAKLNLVTSQLTPITKYVAVLSSNLNALRIIKGKILTGERYLYCKWE